MIRACAPPGAWTVDAVLQGDDARVPPDQGSERARGYVGPAKLYCKHDDIDRADHSGIVGCLDPMQSYIAERALDPKAVASQRFEVMAPCDKVHGLARFR